MRDYNYRKRMKDKEIHRRKELYHNRGYGQGAELMKKVKSITFKGINVIEKVS